MNVSEKLRTRIMEKPCVRWYEKALEHEAKTNPDFDMCETTKWDYLYEVYMIYRDLGKPYNKKLTYDEALEWKHEAQERYAKKTMAKKCASLNRYLEFVCKYKGKRLKVKNIECKRNKTVLSYEQVEDMISFLESKGKYTEALMVYIGFHAGGPRRDNLHRIKIEDLILEGNAKGIRFTGMKGDREHICPISDEVAAKINHYIENHRPKPTKGHEPYLLLMRHGYSDGKKVYDTKIDNVLKYCAKELGITDPVHPHCLRRSFIMWMRRQGKRAEQIKVYTGHKSVKTLYESYIVEEDRETEYKWLNGTPDKTPESMPKPDNNPTPQPMVVEQSTITQQIELVRAQIELEDKKAETLRLQANINNSPNPPTLPRVTKPSDTYIRDVL